MQRQARRRPAQVWALHHQGWTAPAIAQHVGGVCVQSSATSRAPRLQGANTVVTAESVLNPYKPYLLARWNAGCYTAMRLFRDLRQRGYVGGYGVVAAYARRLRQAQGLSPGQRRPRRALPSVAEPLCQPLTPRRAAWLVLRRETERTEAEAQQLAHLRAQDAEVAAAIDLAEEFATLVRQRQPAQLDSWLHRAATSTLEALQRFATGLYEDYEAVKAGVTLPWSSGPVEGHINRLKMLKRQMFGRARLDLLSRRFLLAPRDRRARGPYPQERSDAYPGSGGVGVVPDQGGGRGMSQSRGSGVRRSSGRGATRAGQAGEVEACPRGRRSRDSSACLLGIEVWDILGLSRRHQKWARTQIM